MQSDIVHALDDLTSTRSTWDIQDKALLSLEKLFATSFLSRDRDASERKEELLRLQDSFEYNLSIRIIPWLSSHANSLHEKSSRRSEFSRAEVCALFVRGLNLLQGMALLHASSKQHLGRRASLEVLLDILSIARHSAKPFTNSTNSDRDETCIGNSNASLALAVLDTLLCILADSPPATRVFEQCKGLENTVKLLRRASIPKEVRMKCLELLYLYLMDERSSKTSEFDTELRFSRAISRSSENSPFRSPNNSVTLSNPLSSSSTSSPTSTLVSSASRGSPLSPTKPRRRPEPLCTKSYGMLKRDVDYIPQSPVKPRTNDTSADELPHSVMPPRESCNSSPPNGRTKHIAADRLGDDVECLRSMDEKKELLGRLLGNVDALVEGVKSAGVWGLSP